MARIFISYRRADSITITGRIHDRLVNEYGDQRIFKDVDDIPLGVDFRKVLEDEVHGCDVQLVIIGPDWLTITDQNNQRRLDNPDDFVRIEVAAGLKRSELAVIPVLVRGASMPGSIDLPPDVRELAYRNAAIVRDDPDFHRDMDRLIRQIQLHIKSTTEADSVAEGIDSPQPQTPPKPAPQPTPPKPQASAPKKRAFPWKGVLVLALLAVLIGGALLIGPDLLNTKTPYPVITVENVAELTAITQLTNDDFGSVGQPAWSPDGRLLALPQGNDIGLYENGNLVEPLRRLEDHSDIVNTLAFSADGSLLVSAGDWDDPALRLWDVNSGEVINRFEGFGRVQKVAFSADSQFIAALDDDLTLKIISLETGEVVDPPYDTHPITAFAFSPEGALLALGLGDEAIWLWDIPNNSKQAYFQYHEGEVTDLAFNADGTLLASASVDNAVLVWELTGYDEPIAAFYEHDGTVWGVAFSPDGSRVASVSEDHTARLWDIETGDELAVMNHADMAHDVAFSPDGSLLATICDDLYVYLWDAATGEQRNILGKHWEAPLKVAFNPNGELLLSASNTDIFIWGIP